MSEVKHPQRTKRYTPPKVLEKPAPVPEPESVEIPALPTRVSLAPWSDQGVIFRAETPLHSGAYTLTWGQISELFSVCDQYARQIVEGHEGEPLSLVQQEFVDGGYRDV